jgi:hypothetical protein
MMMDQLTASWWPRRHQFASNIQKQKKQYKIEKMKESFGEKKGETKNTEDQKGKTTCRLSK